MDRCSGGYVRGRGAGGGADGTRGGWLDERLEGNQGNSGTRLSPRTLAAPRLQTVAV